MGAETIKMEVQVSVSRSSTVENGNAGLEAETNSIKWQCRWKQKGRDGMQCRCGSRNSRDSIAGVEA